MVNKEIDNHNMDNKLIVIKWKEEEKVKIIKVNHFMLIQQCKEIPKKNIIMILWKMLMIKWQELKKIKMN